MKREGRQHGMVRSYMILPPPLNPRPEPRFINRLDSPPTAGLFTRVSPKPTNHSKFTGKCGRARCAECHLHPAGKSKDKAKGTRKFGSPESDYRLVTWRVVDAKPGLKLSGFSASGILDQLADDYMNDDDDADADDDIVDGDADDGVIESGAVEIGTDDDDDDDNTSFCDDDDNMSFCDVGIEWEQVEGDEGWCLVGEKI